MESTQTILDGNYLRLSKLGHGATANVYLVKSIEDQKLYAAKVLKSASNNPRFDKEVSLLKMLNCPYIINLVNSGFGSTIKNGVEGKKTPYLILELSQKGELFDYVFLTKEGFGEKNGRYIFKQILQGVKYCHEKGVCHRDLKMENIMLSEEYVPKISDFGFATLIQGKNNDNLLSTPLGTLSYAAPEILMRKAYNGVQSDIFSLGVVMFTLVTCKIGFLQACKKDPYYKLIMGHHYQHYWHAVQQQVSGLSDKFKDLFVKMISYNPNERPSIDEILAHPWFQQEMPIEAEILEEFARREIIVKNKKNENEMEIEEEDENDECFKANEGDEVYFDLELKPKFARNNGLTNRTIMKIKGNVNPAKFMNALANKIVQTSEKFSLSAKENTLKFTLTFDALEKVLPEISPEDIVDDSNLDDFPIVETPDKIENKIAISLLQEKKGNYILEFNKEAGDLGDFYGTQEKIQELVKELK